MPQKLMKSVEKKHAMEKHIKKISSISVPSSKIVTLFLQFCISTISEVASNELGIYLTWTDDEL